MKKLSKITGEVTYSWRMYLAIVDQILSKIVRGLNSNVLANKPVDSKGNTIRKDTNAAVDNMESQKEFTIDEEFFSNEIIPAIYGSLIAGLK